MKEFEDFLRYDNNHSKRPLSIIIRANGSGDPRNNLGLVLYDIADNGDLDHALGRPHFFSSTLLGF